MRRFLAALGLVAAACGSGPAEPAPQDPARLVDLTHSFDGETLYWPTEEGFVHELGPAGVTEGGYWYEAHRFRGAEHGGTHLDAPVHFSRDGVPVEQVPVDRLIGPAVVVDVRSEAARDPDTLVSVADLTAFEERHGRIPDGAIVLLNTGWAERWPDRERYLGTADRGPDAVAGLRFPGLSAEAARWLVAERAPGAVGIDTASIDRGRSRTFEAHRILAEGQVPVFENVASMAELPARGFEVIALPMKIRDGSGAPLRIVARLR